MSKSKKKKANVSAQQKVQQAQGKNEFQRRLNRICMMLPDGKTAWRILEKNMDILYQIRPHPIRIVLVGDKNANDFLEYVQTDYMYIIKHEMTPMYEGGPEVSLYDYQQLVRPLQLFGTVHGHKFPSLASILEPIVKESRTHAIDVVQRLVTLAEVKGLTGSNFMDGFYHVRFKLCDPKITNSPRDACTVEIEYGAPILKQVKIGTQWRLSARVGWRFPRELVWMEVKPSQLGVRKPADDSPMEVYMLQHAANRLYERIGGTYRDQMLIDVFRSFDSLKAFPTGGGNFLMELRIENIKAGYFAATITDGVLLIRTFLFLTHSGTPEGKKLTELTGLRKWDQKYLAFDNLLSLANSDILSNEQTCEIFREAGCGGLLTLCDKIRHSDLWEISDNVNPIAEKLLRYIKSGKEEAADFWMDVPDEMPEGEIKSGEAVPKARHSVLDTE